MAPSRSRDSGVTNLKPPGAIDSAGQLRTTSGITSESTSRHHDGATTGPLRVFTILASVEELSRALIMDLSSTAVLLLPNL